MSVSHRKSTYWQQAYKSLGADLRANLRQAQTGKHDLLKAVLKTVEEKREICLRRKWRITLPNGRVIIVRDVLEKIARWVQEFVAIGDVAVQYNPTSAALPWAAIRFLLQAAISDIKVESAIISDLETISRLITRYDEFERIHLQGLSAVRSQVEECLTRLYADILSFLGIAVGYFEKNSLVRTTKNIFSDPCPNFSAKILQQEAELLKVAALSESERLHYLEDSVTRLVDRVVVYDKAVEATKHAQLVHWLSKIPVSAHHMLRSDERIPGSARWMFDHQDFKTWRNSSSSSILLLHGIPGSGKSVTCSAVIDSYLEQQGAYSQAAPFAYFYCADCKFEPERSQPADIFRCLLRQLTTNPLSQLTVRDSILAEFDRRSAQSIVDGLDLQKLSVKECVKLIQDITVVDPVTIIIDALDEIDAFSRPAVVESLKQVVANSQNVVKVLLTSRNDSHVFALLSEDPESLTQKTAVLGNTCDVWKICITRDCVQEDMKAFVQLQLSKMRNGKHLLKGKISSRLLELLTETLLNGAGEMFQWVNIQLRYLCQQNLEKDVFEILGSGKFRTLDDLVDILEICSYLVVLDERRDTFRFSHQSVQEFLRKSDLFNPDVANTLLATTCIQICVKGPEASGAANLVSLDAAYRYAAMYWPYHDSQISNREGCNTLQDQMVSFTYDEPGDPSLSFMAWMDQMKQITKTLANDHPLLAAQSAIPNITYSPLFVASIFGLKPLVEVSVAFADIQDWDQTNDQGHTSLYLACVNGHASIATLLIERGADFHVQCGKFGNCLQAACYFGHEGVVSLLVARGASVHQQGAFSNALEATFRGQREDIAMLLLQEISTLRTAEEYRKAVEGAALSGFLRVLEQLETSSSASVYNPTHGTDMLKGKIAKAIKGGHTGILRNVLNKTPDPAAVLPPGAVAIAAIYGHDDMIKLLVDAGICLDEECKSQAITTGLIVASSHGWNQTVQKLIVAGAEVNVTARVQADDLAFPTPIRQDFAMTALEAAFESLGGTPWLRAQHGREYFGDIESVVKILLDQNADVNISCGNFRTPLQIAVKFGSSALVRRLIEAGADMNATISDENIFISAVGRGELAFEIVQILLDSGARLPRDETIIERLFTTTLLHIGSGKDHYRVSDLTGESIRESFATGPGAFLRFLRKRFHWKKLYPKSFFIFQMACISGEIDYLELLLMCEIEVDTVCPYQGTALQTASRNGHGKIVRRLLVAGADPNLIGGEHHTALKAAVMGGYHDVVQILLDSGADPSVTRKNHYLVVEAAVRGGHYGILNTLLSHPLLKLSSNAAGLSLLNIAAELGNEEITSMLLDAGIDPAAGPKDQQHALVHACQSGSFKIVESLLRAGARPGIVSNDNCWTISSLRGYKQMTALHISCRYGSDQIVQLLLNYGAGVNTEIDYSKTPLEIAAENGHAKVIQLLISAGANTSHASRLSCLLEEAALNGRVDAVRILLTAAQATVKSIHRLLSAVLKNTGVSTLAILEHLSEAVAKTPGGRLIIQEIVIEWCENVIKDDVEHVPGDHQLKAINLLTEYIGANNYGLLASCISGSVSTVKTLLDCGVSANVKTKSKCSALHLAIRYLHQDVVKLLLDHGADIDYQIPMTGNIVNSAILCCVGHCLPNEPYHVGNYAQSRYEPLACGHHKAMLCEEIVTILVDFGIELEHDSHKFGNTLHLACFWGNASIINMLLSKGLDPNFRSGYFEYPVFAAIHQDDPRSLEVLMKHRADPNASHSKFGPALCYAITSKAMDCAKVLLRHRADPHVRGKSGNSALLETISNDHSHHWEESALRAEVAALILKHGTSLTVRKDDLAALVKSPLIIRGRTGLQMLEDGDLGCEVDDETIISFLTLHDNQGLSKRIRIAMSLAERARRDHLRLLLNLNYSLITPQDILKRLLKLNRQKTVTVSMILKAQTPENLKVLLAHEPRCLITLEIVEVQRSWTLMKLLLDAEPAILPTQTMVTNIIKQSDERSTEDALPELWRRNPNLIVTEPMLMDMDKFKTETLDFLLSHKPPGLYVSTTMLRAALASDHFKRKGFLQLLLPYRPIGKIKGQMKVDIMEADCGWPTEPKLLDLLLECDTDLVITEEMFLASLPVTDFNTTKCEDVALIAEVLQRHKKTLKMTGNMRQRIKDICESKPGPEAIRIQNLFDSLDVDK
ncbi:ankyrin repeat-containing domain protein [Astrocystis sublimbata]|nr:ankyrin repeat-containing domain protein [Astrocystis sublimbata]